MRYFTSAKNGGPVSGTRGIQTIIFAVAACVLLIGEPSETHGQGSRGAGQIGEPVELGGPDFVTRDGVQLAATFYPGYETKETIPVILLHDWKGDRRDFEPLIDKLSSRGFALLVPDLRGHGDSTVRYTLDRRTGQRKETKIDADTFRMNDFQAMGKYDMQVLRRFLLKKNNDEKLNLDQLVVIGAGTGANLAMEWAIYDWSVPNYPGVKQGRDVKAIVLLSPYWQKPGFNPPQAAQHAVLRKAISTMLVVGRQDKRRLDDAERMEKMLVSPTESRPIEERNVWFGRFNSKEQGTDLLEAEDELPDHIERFIDVRVEKEAADAVWQKHHSASGQ